MDVRGRVRRRWTLVALVALAAVGTGPAAAQRDSAAPVPPVSLRPLASLLVPGSGQFMAGQDRGAVYLAAEIYLLSRFLQLQIEANREAERFQVLAYQIARRAFNPTRRDTVFEYFEQMERFVESGRYDIDPGPAFVPESDFFTYNGAVWLLARRTYWEDPDTPPDPMSRQYRDAIVFYERRAVTAGFQWSWRDRSLEHQVYRETIRQSDDGFRRAQNQLGLLLANHIVSAVDALISSRLAAAARRPATVHTSVGPGGLTRVQVTIAF